jgi:cell wall-associated NlpC family hydrolase
VIWFLAAPLIGKAFKFFAILGASIVLMILFGAPIVALNAQTWARWWFSGSHGPVVVSAPIAVSAPGMPAVPVPTLGPLDHNSIVGGVIELARTWLGVRYLWGGCDRRGVDCSCLVRNVWGPFGVSMPRVTVDQMRWATPVAREQIQPGDLVFFNNTCGDCGANPTHVGLAIGGGQMIDAGDTVQIASYTSGYYAAHYASAGRVH